MMSLSYNKSHQLRPALRNTHPNQNHVEPIGWIVSGLSQETQGKTSGSQYPESEGRDRGTLEI